MTRVLVLGQTGMLGHRLQMGLGPRAVDLGSTRSPDATDWQSFEAFLNAFPADTIINAIGHIKQRKADDDRRLNIELNALLPHRLAAHCRQTGKRLIHFSTDCVFSGRKGLYGENDTPDPIDDYGMSKLLGEVTGENIFTLRTSFIGLELNRKSSLIEWFLSQTGPVKGYANAIYTGFTTTEMARVVERVLDVPSDLGDLYHVASDPISKYDLLVKLDIALGRTSPITPDTDFICDRSMTSERFNTTFAYRPPSWDHMIDELASQIRRRQDELKG
jgi:dTDP-4-dehydrorhamnose reductase